MFYLKQSELNKMKKLKLCPKCKKPKLKQATNVSGWLAADMYECTECDYVGRIYIEVEPEEYKKFLEEQDKKEQDTEQ